MLLLSVAIPIRTSSPAPTRRETAHAASLLQVPRTAPWRRGGAGLAFRNSPAILRRADSSADRPGRCSKASLRRRRRVRAHEERQRRLRPGEPCVPVTSTSRSAARLPSGNRTQAHHVRRLRTALLSPPRCDGASRCRASPPSPGATPNRARIRPDPLRGGAVAAASATRGSPSMGGSGTASIAAGIDDRAPFLPHVHAPGVVEEDELDPSRRPAPPRAATHPTARRRRRSTRPKRGTTTSFSSSISLTRSKPAPRAPPRAARASSGSARSRGR